MSVRARVGTLIATSAVLGLMLLLVRGGHAGDEKDLAPGVRKVADMLAKGDKADAAKLAKDLAKNADLDDIMHLFKLRKKKGIGVGKTPGAVVPDGIEPQFLKLGRDEPSQASLKREAGALADMGYVTAAIMQVAHAKPPEKDQGKRTIKDWLTFSEETRDACLAFAEAAKKSPAEVHKAAEKVNNACNNCHMVYRD
jgi:hypothetical protein